MENLENEIWVDVKGYDSLYQVSNLGRVKSLDGIIVTKKSVVKPKIGKILSLTLKDNGYLTVMLSCKGIKKRFYVHRLVGLAFIKNPDKKKTINHINGIKIDNRLENLEWSTHKENNNHSITIGLTPTGEKTKHSKLSKNQVLAIRRLNKINPNFNKLKLSKKLCVSDATIHKIINNLIWKHL